MINKVNKLFKEVIVDFIKENLKLVIGYVLTLLIPLVSNHFTTFNTFKLKINLSVVIFITLIFFMLIVNMIVLMKKYKNIRNENEKLKNPPNVNVLKFQQGDVVILRTEKDLPNPPKLSVYKITESEVVCRNNKDKLVNYAPEELLTKTETGQVFQKIEYQIRKAEQEHQEQMKGFLNW